MIRNSEEPGEGRCMEICIDHANRSWHVFGENLSSVGARAAAAISAIDSSEHNSSRGTIGLHQEYALNELQTFFTSDAIEVEAGFMALAISTLRNQRRRRLRGDYGSNFSRHPSAL
jgi:hypothetical protein